MAGKNVMNGSAVGPTVAVIDSRTIQASTVQAMATA
jgi:hypothetical protein